MIAQRQREQEREEEQEQKIATRLQCLIAASEAHTPPLAGNLQGRARTGC